MESYLEKGSKQKYIYLQKTIWYLSQTFLICRFKYLMMLFCYFLLEMIWWLSSVSLSILNTSEQCWAHCAVCMSSSGLHKVYQDGGGQLCSVPGPSTVPRLLPTPQFPFSWIQTVWYLAGRGTRCIPSQQHQLKLDNTDTAKYLQIKMDITRYQAGGDLEPAELHNFNPNLWCLDCFCLRSRPINLNVGR